MPTCFFCIYHWLPAGTCRRTTVVQRLLVDAWIECIILHYHLQYKTATRNTTIAMQALRRVRVLNRDKTVGS